LWQAVEELAAENGQRTTTVVLNYSGYGYEQNGCPVWLVDALRNRPKCVERVVTYFHELYATGRPWQRAFWYSARQRRVAAEVARMSDSILTNCTVYARWLEEATARPVGSVTSLPVPSNVGEPEDLPDFYSRPPRAVTFGNERWKRFALVDDASALAGCLQKLGITEFVDIGAPSPVDRRQFERAGITVRQLGYLPAEEASRELAQCRVGFVDYPVSYAAKSGVFAAYAAHGVVPVLRRCDAAASDGLKQGFHHLWLGVANRVSDAELAAASMIVVDWYREHDVGHHAMAFQAAFTVPILSSSMT
jgi:hypothetical protein